ncbi:MAG: hypothetical protein V4616_01655 [Bacteroidota bacterium]
MKIDKENYEAWMIDYLEGKLNGRQLMVFEQFLCEHPELREEAEGLGEMKLEPSERFFADKDKLKAKMLKQVIDEEELTSFEAAEGMLSGDKKQRHAKRIEVSLRLKEKLNHYKESKLVADETISYPYKQALYRQVAAPVVTRERSLWPYLAAAAMIAGVVYFVLPEGSTSVDTSNRRLMAELVKEPAKKPAIEVTPAKKTLIAPVAPAIAPVQQVIPQTPVQQNVAVQPKVTNIGAKIKHEAITAPKADLASNPVKETAPVQAERSAPESPAPVQQFAYTPQPLQTKAPYKGRSQANGTVNSNFVKSAAPGAPAAEQEDRYADSKKKLFSSGSKLLARITGDRLKIEEKDNKKVSVKFETQLLGFSTTF